MSITRSGPKEEQEASPPAAEEIVEAAAPEAVPEAEPERSSGWFSRLSEGLSKSSRSITGSISSIFTKKKLDKATLQDLEDVLLQADLGLPMAERIVKEVSTGRYDKEIDPEEVKRILASEVSKVLKPVEMPFTFGPQKPFIILVVGVNGAGKTTTIGKLGAIARAEGHKVMFAACDTFRAAAIEQLNVWGGRIGAKVMSRPTGADASGLAFDAIAEAKADGTFRLTLNDAFGSTHPFELRILKEAPKPPALIAINPILPGAKTKPAESGSSNVPRNGIAALEVVAPNRNAFVLRRAMQLSGFDDIIVDLLDADAIVYGGFSAGAVVAAPSLEGIHLDRKSVV